MVMRSMPLCRSRSTVGARVSDLEIGVSSTMTSAPTMPMTIAGSRLWSSWMAVENALMFLVMIGWPFE